MASYHAAASASLVPGEALARPSSTSRFASASAASALLPRTTAGAGAALSSSRPLKPGSQAEKSRNNGLLLIRSFPEGRLHQGNLDPLKVQMNDYSSELPTLQKEALRASAHLLPVSSKRGGAFLRRFEQGHMGGSSGAWLRPLAVLIPTFSCAGGTVGLD